MIQLVSFLSGPGAIQRRLRLSAGVPATGIAGEVQLTMGLIYASGAHDIPAGIDSEYSGFVLGSLLAGGLVWQPILHPRYPAHSYKQALLLA